MRYAELHAHSAYTFLEGTDSPAALVAEAKELDLTALGIIDVDGMYSAVQTAQAATQVGLPCVYGAELTLTEFPVDDRLLRAGEGLPTGSEDSGLRLPILASSQSGYHDLCSALSSHYLAVPGRRKAAWQLDALASCQSKNWKILTGTAHGPLRRSLTIGGRQSARRVLDQLTDLFGKDNVVVESALRFDSDPELGRQLGDLAEEKGLLLVATGATRCSTSQKQALADVLTATRLNLPLTQAAPHLPPFGTFLRSAEEMLQIHRVYPHAVENAAALADECTFDFAHIRPELPRSSFQGELSDSEWLHKLTYEGATIRYGNRQAAVDAWQRIDRELAVIDSLNFPGYFLIVKDIVDYCRREGILCQGRGSAASSAVCFALGITAVDAVAHGLMFERFLSEARSAAPDIDIDIEAKRREQVIQYVYSQYGRENAAQVANTITYRPRSAVRAAGKALGYEESVVDRWSKQLTRGWDAQDVKEAELPPLVSQIASALQKLPQHMGIHPGGMVLTKTPVSEICPIIWGAKENRTVLQWDKEDCEDAGLVKFDLLGLGMLTALRKSFDWLNAMGIKGRNGEPLGLYNLPIEDDRVYNLLCAAETIGVFQVESRAQMSTLPRLKPREFYDIVIEVALIRPGPIQGEAVNPYLRRRNEQEGIEYIDDSLRPILERTLGVPLFQEQLMQIAIEGAGFEADAADELRRAIGSKHSESKMKAIKPRLFDGMSKRGFSQQVQERIFAYLKGFAEFGFPESHAHSFAHLVYASAWLKVYFPEHFYASLLASQPMGFYSPASLVSDAKKHGVRVVGPSVLASTPEARVVESAEGAAGLPPDKLVRNSSNRTVQLGLESIKGLGKASQERIVEARRERGFADLEDFALRTYLTAKELELLAHSGALEDLGVSRREALWFAARLANPDGYQPFIPGTEIGESRPSLPQMTESETLQADFQSMSLTTGQHPLALLRANLSERGIASVSALRAIEPDTNIQVAGIITHRQRPGTAKGVTFVSLEDETGVVNVVCSAGTWKRFLKVAMTSAALVVRGRLEKKDGALSVAAYRLEPLVLPVETRSRDFR